MKCKALWLCMVVAWLDLAAHPTLDIRLDNIEQAIKQNHSNASLYVHKGEIQRQNRDFSAAGQSFELALKHGASQSIYLFHLAKIARDQHNTTQAINLLTHAIDWQTQQTGQENLSALIYLELAELYLLESQWSDAANSYFKALLLHNEIDPGVYLLTSQLFVQSGEKHLQSALQVIDMGLQRYPGRLCFHKQGIELAFARQQYWNAMERLYELARTNPGLLSKGQQFAQISCKQPMIQNHSNPVGP